MDLRLGPFELTAPIAAGAMGQVWRGRHRGTGWPVAIKTLSAAATARPVFRVALRREIQAVAALSHPGIAAIYDHGIVGAAEAGEAGPGKTELGAAADGAEVLVAGSPWVALELARGDTLREEVGRLDWPRTEAVLRQLLAALAHAHARGILHRDLKPANVLRAEPGRDRVLLADFGLAQALGGVPRGPRALRSAGTPGYMAPEQARGAARDQGPWTDLFALGRLGGSLLTGSPVQLALLRTRHPEAPAGLEAWLQRLTAASPEQRYRRAADALRGLERVCAGGGLDGLLPAGAPAGRPGEVTRIFEGETTAADGPDTLGARTLVPDELDALGASEPGARRRWQLPQPSLPPRWREAPGDEEAGRRMRDVGLGLYGLRPVPLAGRVPEREALWAALGRVLRQDRVEVLVLRGAAGVGKSRLARWLVEQALEVGAADAWGPGGEGPAGLRPGVLAAAALGTEGLEGAELVARVARELRALGEDDPLRRAAVVELLRQGAPLPEGELPVRLEADEERRAVLVELLRRAARFRGLVLWLDDAHRDPGCLALCRELLRLHHPLPLLVLLTVRDELLSPELDQELAALAAEEPERCRSLHLGPLDAGERSELVRGMLGLHGDLATTLEVRSAGNPLFATRLVDDWIQRGVLIPGPLGFHLRAGAEAPLPADLALVWEQVLEGFLDGRGPAEAHLLELAAVLGDDTGPERLGRAAALAGLPVLPQLVEALVARGLVRREAERGWAFVHPMFREAVTERARRGGRLRAWHRACAATYADSPRPAHLHARGRHLLLGGEEVLAREVLGRAVAALSRAGELFEAEVASSLWAEACAADPDPEARARVAIRRAEVALGRGRIDLAHTLVADLPARSGLPQALRARSLELLGRIQRQRGRRAEALALTEEAVEAATELAAAAPVGVPGPDHEAPAQLLASCRKTLADLYVRSGRIGEARALYEQCLGPLAERPAALGGAHLGLAMVHRASGALDAALAEVDRAEAAYRRHGTRRGRAHALTLRGDLHRALDQLDEAAADYALAFESYEATGSAVAVFPKLNLGLVELERGRTVAAREHFTAARERLQRRGVAAMIAASALCLAACDADEGAWPAAGRGLAEGAAGIEATGMVDPDVARLAERIGRSARAAGHGLLAEQALALARDQWRRLGRPERAEAVEALGQGPADGSRAT